MRQKKYTRQARSLSNTKAVFHIFLGVRKRKNKGKRRLVSISPFTIICIAVLAFLGYGMTLLSYVVVLIIHEFAHAFVSEKLGYTLSSVRIMPYGVSIDGDFEGVHGGHEMLIAAAGPLSNLLLWIIITGVWWMYPDSYNATKFLAESSFFTAAVNLIPVYPLDGGRVLHGFLSSKLTPLAARRTTTIISWVCGVIVVAFALYAIISGANYTYATLAIFVLSSLTIPSKGSKYENIYSMSNSAKRLKNGLRVRELMVSKDTNLLALYNMLRADYYTRFIITDGSMCELARITETQLTEYIARFNSSETAISVALCEKRC